MTCGRVNLAGNGQKTRWRQAAEILGVSDRTICRWQERLEKDGYSGLAESCSAEGPGCGIVHSVAEVESDKRPASRRRS